MNLLIFLSTLATASVVVPSKDSVSVPSLDDGEIHQHHLVDPQNPHMIDWNAPFDEFWDNSGYFSQEDEELVRVRANAHVDIRPVRNWGNVNTMDRRARDVRFRPISPGPSTPEPFVRSLSDELGDQELDETLYNFRPSRDPGDVNGRGWGIAFRPASPDTHDPVVRSQSMDDLDETHYNYRPRRDWGNVNTMDRRARDIGIRPITPPALVPSPPRPANPVLGHTAEQEALELLSRIVPHGM